MHPVVQLYEQSYSISWEHDCKWMCWHLEECQKHVYYNKNKCVNDYFVWVSDDSVEIMSIVFFLWEYYTSPQNEWNIPTKNSEHDLHRWWPRT